MSNKNIRWFFLFRYKKAAAGQNRIIKNRRLFMAGNMLTTKEAALISDLLTYEESACKKARLYSRTLTDKNVAEQLGKIADNHQRRFNALFDML